MTASLECPEMANWRALFDDTLPPEECERYERHLESCPVCQERLDRDGQVEETLQRMVRRVAGATAVAADPTLSDFLERLHKGHPERPTPTSPPDLYFLRPADEPGLLGTLGAYEVQEVIGQGGMGVVLAAYEPALHRLVAIKVLSPALAGSASARRRFTREAQAAAAVCHEHVVAVHGVHDAGGLPYLVMQFVPGESLQARLERTGPLDMTEVVRIGMQTAAGLAAAHAQGLIHRDIKPANLLLENGLAKVKITDFGLARMADDVGLTQNGVVAGTPEYMAPEQARGEAVDHRADLFSLGSVLYACCTGRSPFRGSGALAVLRRVSAEEPAPLRALNPDIHAWLEAFIARLMEKDPARRFQSAAEVAALLEGYLAHLRQPTTVLPPPLPAGDPEREPTAAPVPSRYCPAWWARSSFWVAAALVAVAGLGLFRWLAAGDGPPAPKPPAELYLDFRGGNLPLRSLSAWSGKEGDEVIEPEDKGLRIGLPANHQHRFPVGLVLNVPVKGNFEITTGYEIVSADRPRTGGGVGYELYLTVDTPRRDALVFSRVTLTDGSETYVCGRMTTVNGSRRGMLERIPTAGPNKSGRLRLTRQGTEVTFWAAEGEGAELRKLGRCELGPEDLTMVRMSATPGQAPEPVEVRLVDVRVRSDTPIPPADADGKPSAGMKKGVAIVVVLGLAFTAGLVALAVWFLRPRRGAAPPPAPAAAKGEKARPAAAGPVVSFVCPDCRAGVKAPADQAGKKGKCPQCGKPILVPAASALRAGPRPS
jgi:serine/threonine protein kinase